MVKLKRKLNRRIKNLSWLHLTLVAVVLTILAGVAYVLVKNPEPVPRSNTSTTQSTKKNGPPVNLNPATPQEKKATENYKKNSTTPQTPPETTASGKIKVYPVITNVSNTEVNAYVSGVLEDGGICTATATNGSQTKKATSVGFANVSDTSCSPIRLSLPSSGWTVIVNYSSASYEGTSQAYAY